jgi:uncharacterized protein (DUF2235 family)
MARDLVVLCDGTGNELRGGATNVLRLYQMLRRDGEQIVYYDSGVGTTPAVDTVTPYGFRLMKKLDSAVGLSIRHHLLKAYRFLVRHYEPGDRIWLFGFSRGAYTVRALAGALFNFGLLRPELLGLEDLMWEYFDHSRSTTSPKKDKSPDTTPEQEPGDRPKNFFEIANIFRRTFARQDVSEWGEPPHNRVKIHFCGVWDTVSAFGLIWDLKSLPNTANCPSLVHIRHALALDERRAMFRANLFRPRNATKQQPVNSLSSMKQVWFPGVHSDVGGGYREEHSALAKVSLEWMLAEAEPLGLQLDAVKRQRIMAGNKQDGPSADPCGRRHESLERFWHIAELVPMNRFDDRHVEDGWFPPNFWRPRPVLNFDMTGEPCVPVIHQSVLTRMKSRQDYKPKNFPADGTYVIEPPQT